MTIERLNQKGMYADPAYPQGVVLPASARIVLVGGQNGVGANGQIVGKGDIAAQTARRSPIWRWCPKPAARGPKTSSAWRSQSSAMPISGRPSAPGWRSGEIAGRRRW